MISTSILACISHSLTHSHTKQFTCIAEAQLKGAEKTPNYSLVLMAVVKNQSIPPQIRLSGALALKNFVRTKWENEDELKEPERAQIKQNALDLMLSTTGNIQTQMSGMISIICEYDFHQKWPQLLPVCLNLYTTFISCHVFVCSHALFFF